MYTERTRWLAVLIALLLFVVVALAIRYSMPVPLPDFMRAAPIY